MKNIKYRRILDFCGFPCYNEKTRRLTMHTSTISTRGQTTIPIDIQRLLNVKSGDKIQYFLEPDGRVTILPKTLSIKDMKGILPKTGKSVSIEDMNEAIMEEAALRAKK